MELTVRGQALREPKVEPVLKQLHKMGTEIPVIVTYCVGRDVGGDFDYGATFVVKNIDDYKTYMHSPIHRKVDDLGLPLVADMVSFDITDEQDETIPDQIKTSGNNSWRVSSWRER